MNRFISSDLVRWVCPTACQRRTLSYCIEGCGAILRHCFALVWILQKSVMWWPWHRLCYCFPDRYLSLNEHIKTGILVEESGIRNQGGFTGNFWSKFHVTTWSCLRSYSSIVQHGSLSFLCNLRRNSRKPLENSIAPESRILYLSTQLWSWASACTVKSIC